MADRDREGPIAPRRNLSGPILPPPPPELAEEREKAESARRSREAQQAEKEAARRAQEREKQAREREKQDKRAAREREKATTQARKPAEKPSGKRTGKGSGEPAAQSAQSAQRTADSPRARATASDTAPTTVLEGGGARAQDRGRARDAEGSRAAQRRPRRTRRARLRLVQVDAWSVMKTAFLLSIALGIVLVVAVAIIWTVLGAAGVWDSINSVVQQGVGGDNGSSFDVEQYVGMSRVLGFAMIVAVLDVILITAIATLGAFLYNLAAALLGGIEVVLAEDS